MLPPFTFFQNGLIFFPSDFGDDLAKNVKFVCKGAPHYQILIKFVKVLYTTHK